MRSLFVVCHNYAVNKAKLSFVELVEFLLKLIVIEVIIYRLKIINLI